VVLTNGTDSTGQISLPNLISSLETQQVPVHILAFGVDGQSAGTLAAIAQVAGGNSVAVNSATDVRASLQTLILLLQQGYRLDFTSGLQADDNAHNLTVALAAGGLAAEATSEFIARSRPITVTFPNVEDGATVSGALNLTAQADAPAAITSVVYRLNGDLLAEVADTSFSIVWNSDTVEPGDYTVVAEVVDAAGNSGTASVSFVVVAPVTVAATLAPANSDGDIEVGDQVTVNAEVEVFSGQAQVEFLVDGALIFTDNQPPYSASFDSAQFGAGSHTISVIASDGAGHQATSTLDMVLVAAPTPTPEATPTPASFMPAVPAFDWWRILTWVAMIAIALVALWMVISAVGNARKSASEQKLMPMRLTLSNLGNVATGYLLRGEDPAGALNFRFSVQGVVLGLPPVARLTDDGPVAQRMAAIGGQGARPAFGNVRLPNIPQVNTEAISSFNAADAADKLEEASQVGRIIAGILASVAMFLPRPLAAPIRQVVMLIRRGQMFSSRVRSVRRQVERLNKSEMGQKVVQGTADAAGQVGRAATDEATRGTLEQGASRAGGVMATTAAVAVAGAKRTANRLYDLGGQVGSQVTNGVNGGGAAAGARQWVYVPPVSPGETVTIDVMVGANGRGASGGHQSFRILSRALGEENAQPVVEEGSIRIAKSSPWPSLLRLLLAVVVTLIAIALIWLLAGTIF
jgi:hypothetical protein